MADLVGDLGREKNLTCRLDPSLMDLVDKQGHEKNLTCRLDQVTPVGPLSQIHAALNSQPLHPMRNLKQQTQATKPTSKKCNQSPNVKFKSKSVIYLR